MNDTPACPCVCGADLAIGKSNGIWTLCDVACEYRTCAACGSTRAFMGANHVAGRAVKHYANADDGEIVDEHSNFLDALDMRPLGPTSALVRNGVTLAKACMAINGEIGWFVLPPTREEPAQ